MSPKKNQEAILLCFLLLGVLSRSILLFANNSLWFDEATFATNIIQRSWLELTGNLDFELIVPIGYSWCQKFIGELFGFTEWSLRLISYFASILTFFIVYKLFKQQPFYLRFFSLLTAILSLSLMNYAVDNRRYSLEVAMSALLFYDFVKGNQKRFFFNAFFGLFFTFSVYILLPVLWLYEKQKILRFRKKDVVYLIWLLCALIYYFSWLFQHKYNNIMHDYHGAVGNIYEGGNVFNWGYERLMRLFVEPMGLSLRGICFLLMILGGISLFKKYQKIHPALFLIVLAMLLSFTGAYPLGMRFSIYMFLPLLSIIGIGLKFTMEKSKVIGFLVIFLLLLNPLVQFGKRFNQLSEPKEDWRSAYQYLAEYSSDSSDIYFSINAYAPFLYYKHQLKPDWKVGVHRGDMPNNLSNFKQQIIEIESSTFWVVIGHDYPSDIQNSEMNKLEWLATKYNVLAKMNFKDELFVLKCSDK